MKPQQDEPCNDCRYWNDETGCKMGRYESASMMIFGYCGYAKPKNETENGEK